MLLIAESGSVGGGGLEAAGEGAVVRHTVPLGFLAVEVDLLQGLGGLERPGVLEGQPGQSLS